MRKDYWNISKRNFRAMAVVVAIVAIIFGLTAYSGNIPDPAKTTAGYTALFFGISFVFFVATAILFMRHSPKAITIGYAYTGLAFIYVLIANFVMSNPLDGTIYKVGGLLVLLYLFYNVYKASKQRVPSAN
jgi:hypothetical protein